MFSKLVSFLQHHVRFPENYSSNNDEKMERIAIDQSGSLGSLYDACRDTMLGKLAVPLKSQASRSTEPATCRIYKGRTAETLHLLDTVDIDRSLQLSITLKIVQPTGIVSLIDYPHSINRYTRFLYFYHRNFVESCHNITNLIKKSHQLIVSETSATHIITEIVYGIHVIVVLQLSSDEEAQTDRFLENIRQRLIKNDCFGRMTSPDEAQLRLITSTTVYSNIPDLNKLTKLNDICQRITQLRTNSDEHRRLAYNLCSIQSLYPEYNGSNIKYVQFHTDQVEKIKDYLLQQSSTVKRLTFCLDHELSELLQGILQEQLLDIRQDFSEIEDQYKIDIQKIQNLILMMRKGQTSEILIDENVSLDPSKETQDRIDNITRYIDALKAKSDLIKQLQKDGFEYCNIVNLGINQGCDQDLMQRILFKNNPKKVILCSHDLLKDKFEGDWTHLYEKMMEKHKKNPHLCLIYADFTYSTFYLEKMTILLPKEQTIDLCQSNSDSMLRKTKRKAPSPPSTSKDECINILLLGESGVGKSTFINAFANYLQFDTLENAQAGKPVVVIPVSFLMTVSDNFDEKIVKFGDVDPNEDHSNSGQSVTQQCRSYIFEISHRKKLRIIDTPGFGDTRGENQDELNMEVIFSFINNLSYLNGVCLLFKPNSAQLNPFVYSCFTQLFRLFGENIRDHFIFCFTNARSTFFAPGDTRPLLKSFFDSFPVKKIPLEKKNTFCFDSESFRYLVALQQSLTFNEIEKDEFEKSWLRSVIESKRFRDYLCEELHPYCKNEEWQSVQEAEFQISFMIRPMLETIRNILRNMLLHETNSSIQLNAICVDHPTVICYKCHRTTGKFGPCWILLDYLHSLPSECTSNEQSPTEYRLNYEFRNHQTIDSLDNLHEQQKLLCEASSKLARFLITNQMRQDDPFLSGLIRMADEENSNGRSQNENDFNQQLADRLKALLKEYTMLSDETQSNGKVLSLSNIYNLIKSIYDLPMMKEQIDSIKKYQQCLLKSKEQSVDAQQTRL